MMLVQLIAVKLCFKFVVVVCSICIKLKILKIHIAPQTSTSINCKTIFFPELWELHKVIKKLHIYECAADSECSNLKRLPAYFHLSYPSERRRQKWQLKRWFSGQYVQSLINIVLHRKRNILDVAKILCYVKFSDRKILY